MLAETLNPMRQMTVSLPDDMALMVREKVASGDYASEDEVINEALRNLQVHDAMIEKWLREEVVPTYDAYVAAPSEVISIDDVFEGLEARRRARKATGG